MEQTVSSKSLINVVSCSMRVSEAPTKEIAYRIYTDEGISTEELLEVAQIARNKHFGNRVQIHILNNVRNGNCSEDCSYCAQRKDDDAEYIPEYSIKTEEEILDEAKDAHDSGAFRYCLVLSGKGPTQNNVNYFANIVKKIKHQHPGMEVCLSAGILTNPDQAEILRDAGLDRYNHNLNTSMAHYDDICTTHQYADRMNTIQVMRDVGVSLCSGVIVGMGESDRDLIDVAYSLHENRVASIPVNFFIPVPGHAVENPNNFTPDQALRILAIFRIINPEAEIRMAAGREMVLGKEQGRGLLAANSLFVSGYLNVHGSNISETLEMLDQNGYEPDLDYSDRPDELKQAIRSRQSENVKSDTVVMKNMRDLRPYSK